MTADIKQIKERLEITQLSLAISSVVPSKYEYIMVVRDPATTLTFYCGSIFGGDAAAMMRFAADNIERHQPEIAKAVEEAEVEHASSGD